MISLSARVNIIKFTEVANGLPREDAERIAGAFPDLFRDALVFGAEVPNSEPPPVAKSVPRSAPVDMTALTSTLHLLMAATPRLRSEDYAAKVAPSDYRATAETIKPAVKKALEQLVTNKLAYCEGDGRGRRYWLATKPAEATSEGRSPQ